MRGISIRAIDATAAYPNKPVLVSGFRIVAPTCAYWLALHGFKTTLVEIAPRLRADGYAQESAEENPKKCLSWPRPLIQDQQQPRFEIFRSAE